MKPISPLKNTHIDIHELNEKARDPEKFILECEEGYENQIASLVKKVLDGEEKIVLLAGPTSSGKTTTANKISKKFLEFGVVAPVVSLDDFFLGISHYPKLPDGTPDMEAFETLDILLINETFKTLISEGKAYFPLFDFTTSSRKKETHLITLPKQGVLIVEGIHALNPKIYANLNGRDVFKSYVSTRTQYMDGDKVVLTPKDSRLIRRIVRDYNFRGKSPDQTLNAWGNILDGELKHIVPFRDSVDFKIDSAMDYEGCVFHHFILPLLSDPSIVLRFSEKASQLKAFLDYFHDIEYDFIPKDSLLREFIGKEKILL